MLAIPDIPSLVHAANIRIGRDLVTTPLLRSRYFSDATGANVHFKMESLQVTGSFKGRGALNKMAGLDDAARKRGVIAASTGNHGAAVAFAAQRYGTSAVIFMPQTATPAKVLAIRRLGAEIRFHGTDSGLTEVFAHRFADQAGMPFISPYNDKEVIAGQGTIALELLHQVGRIDEIYVSVGGGGLLSGIAGYLRASGHATRINACSPVNDHAMFASVRSARIVAFDGKPTIADGCSGGLEDNAITLSLVRDLADEWILLEEIETMRAMRLFIENDNQLLEGSAGLAIAALLRHAAQNPARLTDRNIVIVVCGSRIGAGALQEVLECA